MALLAVGCTKLDDRPPWLVSDSAGVEIVLNERSSLAWRLSEEPVLSLGVVDQGGPTEFFRVQDIAILNNGDLAVANRGSEEVRLFTAEGRHRATFGGKGHGPREFSLLAMVESYGDSLLAYDEGNDRISVWKQSGRFGRSFRLEWYSGLLGPVDLRGYGGILTVTARYMSELRGEGLIVDTALVSAYDLTGHLIDSIARLPHNERVVRRQGDLQITLSAPFSARGQIVGVAPGFCYAFGAAADILCFDLEGVLRRIIRVSLTPRPVTDEHVSAFWEEQRAGAEGPRSDAFQRLRESMPFPGFFPTYSQLLVDDAGRLWARLYTTPEERNEQWLIFEDGRLVAELVSPRGFRVMDVKQDRVAGVRTNTLGVEFVEVREAIRP